MHKFNNTLTDINANTNTISASNIISTINSTGIDLNDEQSWIYYPSNTYITTNIITNAETNNSIFNGMADYFKSILGYNYDDNLLLLLI